MDCRHSELVALPRLAKIVILRGFHSTRAHPTHSPSSTARIDARPLPGVFYAPDARFAQLAAASTIFDVFTAESRTELPEHIQRSEEHGHEVFESMHIRGDGSSYPVQIDTTFVRGYDQTPFCRAAVVQDISERHEAKAAATRYEERYRWIMGNCSEAVFILDVENDALLDVNDPAAEILGYSRKELLSVPISKIHPDEMPRFRAFVQRVNDEGTGQSRELTCRTKDGRSLDAIISATTFDWNDHPCVLALVRAAD